MGVISHPTYLGYNYSMLGRKKETELSSQEVRTILGPGCLFEGNLTLPDGLARIDGEVIVVV
jgi:hypothetical protein